MLIFIFLCITIMLTSSVITTSLDCRLPLLCLPFYFFMVKDFFVLSSFFFSFFMVRDFMLFVELFVPFYSIFSFSLLIILLFDKLTCLYQICLQPIFALFRSQINEMLLSSSTSSLFVAWI